VRLNQKNREEGESAMNFFGGLFGGKDDLLRGNAERLVPSASAFAVSMFVPLLEQFPSVMRNVKSDQGDFFITIAGVFIAATRLANLKIGDQREQKLMDIVARGLTQWDPNNGIRAFEDCKAMFERNFDVLTNGEHEPRFIASDAVGMWIVWNLLTRCPEAEEERKLVRAIGVAVTHTFFSWWE
jgi:hypothetical protein